MTICSQTKKSGQSFTSYPSPPPAVPFVMVTLILILIKHKVSKQLYGSGKTIRITLYMLLIDIGEHLPAGLFLIAFGASRHFLDPIMEQRLLNLADFLPFIQQPDVKLPILKAPIHTLVIPANPQAVLLPEQSSAYDTICQQQ